MPTTQEIYEDVLQGVATMLTPEGFRRSKAEFRRRLSNGQVRWNISFQKSQYSTSEQSKFTVWVHAEWKHRPAYCEDLEPSTTWYGGAGDRIGYLMPQKQDTWWQFDKRTCPSLLSTEVNSVLWSCGLTFLRQFEAEEDIRDYLRSATEGEMKSNYLHSLTMLSFDVLESKPSVEIEKSIERVRQLGRRNGVKESVTDAAIQRLLIDDNHRLHR